VTVRLTHIPRYPFKSGQPDEQRQAEVEPWGLAPGVTYAPMQLWQNSLDSAPAGEDAHTWFSEVLGVPVRLVYLDDPLRRRPKPALQR
jgi:uncharacterized protein YcbX